MQISEEKSLKIIICDYISIYNSLFMCFIEDVKEQEYKHSSDSDSENNNTASDITAPKSGSVSHIFKLYFSVNRNCYMKNIAL